MIKNVNELLIQVQKLENYKPTKPKVYFAWCCKPAYGTTLQCPFTGITVVTSKERPFLLSGTRGELKVVSAQELASRFLLADGTALNKDFFVNKADENGNVAWFKVKFNVASTKSNPYAFYISSAYRDLRVMLNNICMVANPSSIAAHGKGDFVVVGMDDYGNITSSPVVVNGLLFGDKFNNRGWTEVLSDDIIESPEKPESLNSLAVNTDNICDRSSKIAKALNITHTKYPNLIALDGKPTQAFEQFIHKYGDAIEYAAKLPMMLRANMAQENKTLEGTKWDTTECIGLELNTHGIQSGTSVNPAVYFHRLGNECYIYFTVDARNNLMFAVGNSVPQPDGLTWVRGVPDAWYPVEEYLGTGLQNINMSNIYDVYIKLTNPLPFNFMAPTSAKEYHRTYLQYNAVIECCRVKAGVKCHSNQFNTDFYTTEERCIVVRSYNGSVCVVTPEELTSAFITLEDTPINMDVIALGWTRVKVDITKRKPLFAKVIQLPQSFRMRTNGVEVTGNLHGIQHEKGDVILCPADANGKPDLRKQWVVNGAVFRRLFDLSYIPEYPVPAEYR